MKRRVGFLSLIACALAACSGGGEEMRGPAAGDAPRADDQDTPSDAAPAQSVSIAEGTVPVKVKVVMGRVNYSEEGTGECASSTESSIYDVPATQWHVTYGGDGSNIQHLNLTVWRPRAGGPGHGRALSPERRDQPRDRHSEGWRAQGQRHGRRAPHRQGRYPERLGQGCRRASARSDRWSVSGSTRWSPKEVERWRDDCRCGRGSRGGSSRVTSS